MFLVDVVDVVVVWVGEVLFVGVFLLKCNVTGQKWSPRIFWSIFVFFFSFLNRRKTALRRVARDYTPY